MAQQTLNNGEAASSFRNKLNANFTELYGLGIGEDGSSAYEIAVANGFVGNESAWLASLVGADGADGDVGPQGVQGIQGVQGDPGADGQGVPVGGTSDQVLSKIDATNFNTQWVTIPSGDMLASSNLSDLANAATARTNLGVAIGSDVQAYSVVLDATTASFTIADELKLDGIEASADVTDTTNVTAAGALMDSEVTNLAQVKAFSSADYATAAQGTLANSATQPGDLGVLAELDTVGISHIDNGAITIDKVSAAIVTSLGLADTAVQPLSLDSYITGDAYESGQLIIAASWRTALSISNVDNTSDANKPISTATQTALNLKVTSDPTGITGADSVSNIVSLTQAEYDAIGSPDASTFYIITDAV